MAPISTITSRAATTIGSSDDDLREGLSQLYSDRPLAHRVLFEHKNKTPAAAEELIGLYHNCPTPYLIIEGFRGFAKSTNAEEAIAIQSGFSEFRNCLIVGAKAPLAAERLTSIKAHFANEMFIEAFGDLRGPVWSDEEIVLSTQARILAVGRGMSLLGSKYLESRPDLVLIDDLEKPEESLSYDQRKAAHTWLLRTLLPALDPDARVIMLGTQRDTADIFGMVKADIEQAMATGEDTLWTARKYPIEYLDAKGERQPTWPDRFSLARIDRLEASYRRQGALREYRIEYMCQVDAADEKVFRNDSLRVEPTVRTWQPVYTMHDPARTVGAQSATTGFAAWSYIGPKIVVWEAWGRKIMPDEIVNTLFTENDNLQPVEMGFEEDGLNEWALQLIRKEQVNRRIVLPLRRMRAPKGKLDFIRGLQTYAAARELVFAKELPDLKKQLLAFPSPPIDVPNALAYALRMKPGAPIYDDFAADHIAEGLSLTRAPAWLAINAGHGVVTGMLLQFNDGMLRVYADWVREGDPGEVIGRLVRDAATEAGQALRYICPPVHFELYNNIGLVQAANRVPVEVRSGTEPARGRTVIREMLQKRSRGFADVLVSSDARWTLNGFNGGYHRDAGRNGLLAEHAAEGPYRVLMEGLEAFAGLITLGMDDQGDRNYRTRPDGSRYVSTLRDGR